MSTIKKYYNKNNQLIAKCDLVLDKNGKCTGNGYTVTFG
jgi:hypothetical protein